MSKKVSVEDLIAKKAGRKETTMIDIEGLGQIEAKRLPMKHVLEMMNGIDEENISAQMDFSCKLIYESCPIFRDRELQDAYKVKKPADVVMAVFEGEVQALGEIVAQLMTEFYGIVGGSELERFHEE